MTMIYTGTTISFQSNNKFHQAHASHPSFKEIVDFCKKQDYTSAVGLLDLKAVISSVLKGTSAELRDSNVYYKGEVVHSVLARRILTLVKEGFDATPLLLFLENLMDNPSKRAVDELYGFLEVSGLPITEDGHFLAYKSVRLDYKDHYTGTMDNSVGQTVSMARNGVDEDKDRTCSKGLHFAAHEYASGFGHSDSRMIVLKINPKDVVAIPSDYNNQKGRCCSYVVTSEVERQDKTLVNSGFVNTGTSVPSPELTPASVEVGKSYVFSGRIFGSHIPQPFQAIVESVGTNHVGKNHVSIKVKDCGSFQSYGLHSDSVNVEPLVEPVFSKDTIVIMSALGIAEYGDQTNGKNTGVITDISSNFGDICVLWDESANTYVYKAKHLELYVEPAYVPVMDNYDDSGLWEEGDGFTRFQGTHADFPVNRDVPYTLRKLCTKPYRGDFFFTNYDVLHDNLVFARMGFDGKVERYITITNSDDWAIIVSD